MTGSSPEIGGMRLTAAGGAVPENAQARASAINPANGRRSRPGVRWRCVDQWIAVSGAVAEVPVMVALPRTPSPS